MSLFLKTLCPMPSSPMCQLFKMVDFVNLHERPVSCLISYLCFHGNAVIVTGIGNEFWFSKHT